MHRAVLRFIVSKVRSYFISPSQRSLRRSLAWSGSCAPDAFVNLVAPAGGPEEVATMPYFSLTTLTITGYGGIVAVDPFARSLANLEAVIGQFYLAITVARLVTLELADRRR